LSKACISQTLENQSSWVIDLGAFGLNFGNPSLSSSIFLPNIPHVMTLANGSKASQGVSQISLSPSLNLKHILLFSNCPFNLISLGQLTKSLNCSITFQCKFFGYTTA